MENKEKENGEPVIPINLKVMKFIVSKSKELETSHPSISYYCLLYVVHKLHSYVKVTPNDKVAMSMLKITLNESETIAPRIDKIDYNDLATFCENLIKGAERKSGTFENLKTAIHLFYTCQIFYEILTHFQELNEEQKKKYKYAKYKTVFLKKCLDENRNPNEESIDAISSCNTEESKEVIKENNAKTYTTTNLPNIKIVDEKELLETEWKEDNTVQIESNYLDISESLKQAQHAVNALMFEDVETATLCLKRSLAALQKKPYK